MNANTMSNVNMAQNAQFNFSPQLAAEQKKKAQSNLLAQQQAAAQQQSAMQNAPFNFLPQQAAAQQQSGTQVSQYNLLVQQALAEQGAKPYFSLEQLVAQHGPEALGRMKATSSSMLQHFFPGTPQSLNGLAYQAPPAAPTELPVASLQQLRQADATAVRTVLDALTTRGFIWLRFEAEDALAQAAEVALPAAGDFLAQQGASGTLHAMQGHFSTAQKDGLRFVTGTSLEHTTGLDKVPAETQALLKQLAQQFDQAQIDIVAALGPSLLRGQFRDAPSRSQVVEKVGEFYDIPLLQRAEKGMTSYGLLDIVRYRMGPKSPDEVVAAHTDPGLFILSLPCSTPGLELQDEALAWRSPPPGLGVLWAGNAAAMLRQMKSGMHRVRATPDRAPRLSAWHELCTRAQLCPPMLGALEANGRELKLGDLRGTDAVLRHLQAAEDHRDRLHDAQLVRRRGVPVGKSGVRVREEFVPIRSDDMKGDVDRFSIFKTNVFLKGPAPPGMVEIVKKEDTSMDVDG
mmetsp:Transcript_37262/g.89065  ORF Transcript_37262/g.89065 Transcript_37262/m.89065 type:complete len:515 (-) Transcript_37262:246-1790(-)